MIKLGERLLQKQTISEEQLQAAIERQRLQGGLLGQNLIALGFIRPEDLEEAFKHDPPPPRTVADTRLELVFLADLTLKHIVTHTEFGYADLIERLKLSMQVMDQVVEYMRKQRLIEVKGAAEYTKTSWKFAVTEAGRHRAAELHERCRYHGPAPVLLEDYRRMIELQTIKSIYIDEGVVREHFSRFVIDDQILNRLGPAVSSGRSIFLYGPPGNGKTTIAEAIGRVMPGEVYLPHALLVDNEIITVFDPVCHIPVAPRLGPDEVDQRWILVKRPVIMVGGEFTLKSLDLEYNPIARFYQAALQMKANNGIFIVDDFGRQQIEPQNLLNRWIVPLERRTDFLSLHTGLKFEIPFDQLVIFSTNLEPKKLVDEAFLRRIRYKINIDHPNREQFETIFRRICTSNGIDFKDEVFQYLLTHYYQRLEVPFNSCHPRDIVDHIIDCSHYRNRKPELTTQAIDDAWDAYFVEM